MVNLFHYLYRLLKRKDIYFIRTSCYINKLIASLWNILELDVFSIIKLANNFTMQLNLYFLGVVLYASYRVRFTLNDNDFAFEETKLQGGFFVYDFW